LRRGYGRSASSNARRQYPREHAAEARANAAREGPEEAERQLAAHERAEGDEVQSYAGFGATKANFVAHNNVTEGVPPAEPAEGTDEYAINSLNSQGRVIAYTVTTHFSPPESARELLILGGGIYLPGIVPVIRETSTCMVWRSSNLRRLIGKEYAQATTETESISFHMEAVSQPTC
jgi:hypothetical protein